MKRMSPAIARPRTQLEVRDLELVLSLAAAGTTAGAASALHITQSAISRALGQAEDRVGARLFERSARGVTPTAAGRRLIAGAGLVLTQLSELERDVRAPVPFPTRLRIVCECYTAYRWLPSALASLRERLPDIEVEIATEHTLDPIDALLSNHIDVALLTTASLPTTRAARDTFVEQPLLADEVVFVVGASHPLARAQTLTRVDLDSCPLITAHAPAAEERWFLTSVFGRHKPRLRFLRLPLTEAIVDAARAGMGIAVLSEWMASGYLGGRDLLVKRLRSGPLLRSWRIAYRRDVAVAAERVIGPLQSSAPRLPAAQFRAARAAPAPLVTRA